MTYQLHECAEVAIPITPCPGCGARRYACSMGCGDLTEWTDHSDDSPDDQGRG
ncbi:hypothetical protein [Ornithinimicrobium sufpigmenti]|uniref:hypothetical protein n=1 Tax=Ornithinimicrobium sufpigmenti TaxID=2508882 RepID=UPI0015E182A3|nr:MULTISPECIES: hypothetical protein [unclassified Ornithinimicrobium]